MVKIWAFVPYFVTKMADFCGLQPVLCAFCSVFCPIFS